MPDRSLYERETFIGWNDEEELAWVSCCSPRVKVKLTRLLGPPARELSPGSWSWKIPKTWVRLPRPTSKRPQSEAQKASLRKAKAVQMATRHAS